MAFSNARQIVQTTSGLDTVKLLLLTARYSRPRFAAVWKLLLRPFERNHEIPVVYRHANRRLRVFIRDDADASSDLHSMLEVVVRRVYPLDLALAPDLVIDGGGNIGLFTLEAAAAFPAAHLVICEPLPRNIDQIQRHLDTNHIAAEILPVCIGGQRGSVPFYCRGANNSSFDPHDPYDSILESQVLSLADILADRPARRILLKLDIEGMEVDALTTWIPTEQRAVILLCELHGHIARRPALEQLFHRYGWSVHFGELDGYDAIFEARSPAAQAASITTAAAERTAPAAQ